MRAWPVLLPLFLACGQGGADSCDDPVIPLPEEYVADFWAIANCTGLSSDPPMFLELPSVPCPDGSGKFCVAGTTKGGEHRPWCDAIVVQQLPADPTPEELATRREVVAHESIHHLLAESGEPLADHCHPAFVACDPRPRTESCV